MKKARKLILPVPVKPTKILYIECHHDSRGRSPLSHSVVEENKETGWKRYADGHESYPYYGPSDWRGF